jgi:DNA gyrase/topoisomerase IV subunit A
VEEYEARIAALEYQLEMLKRQGGANLAAPAAQPAAEAFSLLLFHPRGRVLRLPLAAGLSAGAVLGQFASALDPQEALPGLASAHAREELLFVFDSGRILTLPVEAIPTAGAQLDWQQAYRVDPRPGEELVAVLPIARLALSDYCVQVSRRACAKLMPKTSFQSLVARGTIGAGIKRKPDKTAALALCTREDSLVFASRDGYLVSLPIPLLPYTVEEIFLLGANDSIVSAFNPAGKNDLLALTNNGKVIQRELSWLEPVKSFKSHGQALYSAARREAGVRLIGAAALDRAGWVAVLRSDGSLAAYDAAGLFAAGTLDPGPGELLAMTAFSLAGQP